jgi:general secretion pathway protein B
MSFILDALKKSEVDRQQQGSTEFTSMPSSKASVVVPRWLWIICILLVVNLAVLIGLLQRLDSKQVATEVSTTKSIMSEVEDKPKTLPNFLEQVENAKQSRPDLQQEIQTSDKSNLQSNIVEPILASQELALTSIPKLYPSIYEIRASDTRNIPELHLDIHAYDDDPSGRFVFINMVKYREGSRLDGDLIVSEITPDGVVLDHEGQLLLLPRE